MKSLKTSFLILLTISFFISCKKEFSYEGGNIGLTSGTWQFVNNAIQYEGNIDSASIRNASGTKELILEGKSLSGPELFRIRLYSNDSFTTKSYSASLYESLFDYYTLVKTIFKADIATGEFTVNITSLANNRITGTFSGQVEDSTGAQTQITLGAFTSGIDLSNNGNGQGGNTSVGTLGANPDTCSPVILSNNYTQGISFTPSNTVQVQVNVISTGTYFITTNFVNGVTFSKSGIFANTGIQNVILTGNGTPQNQGLQYFTVTYGTSNCVFQANFLPGAAPATGTLGGSGGSCTPVTPAGTYTQGVALSASNTITVQANVTTIGAYSITTNTVNGVTFTASGNFTTTGINSVVLTGSGTPTNAGPQTFAVSFGTSTCNFAITFAAGTLAVYSCKIDGVLTNFSDQAHAEVTDISTGQPALILDGFTPNSSTNEFQISISKNDAGVVGPGSYDEKNLFVFPGGYAISVNYATATELWLTYSNSIFGNMPPFTIVVTSVSATRVKGTFSGSLGDQLLGPSTVFKTITEGIFDLPIQ